MHPSQIPQSPPPSRIHSHADLLPDLRPSTPPSRRRTPVGALAYALEEERRGRCGRSVERGRNRSPLPEELEGEKRVSWGVLSLSALWPPRTAVPDWLRYTSKHGESPLRLVDPPALRAPRPTWSFRTVLALCLPAPRQEKSVPGDSGNTLGPSQRRGSECSPRSICEGSAFHSEE